MNKDWVDDPFVRCADLSQPFLEERQGRTEELAYPGKRSLHLNCGIRRHSIFVVKEGCVVTGIDISPRFVEQARELAAEQGVQERTELMALDGRRVRLLAPRKLSAVISMDTSFGDGATDKEILGDCLTFTEPGGLLILDIGFRDWIVRSFKRRGPRP